MPNFEKMTNEIKFNCLKCDIFLIFEILLRGKFGEGD